MHVPRSGKVYKLSKVYVICRLVSNELFARSRVKTTDIAESVFITPGKVSPHAVLSVLYMKRTPKTDSSSESPSFKL